MKTLVILSIAVLLLGSVALSQDKPSASDRAPLLLVQEIPLPNVGGRIDHFTFDAKRKRVIGAALGNNTVEVVDTFSGIRDIHSITGAAAPQGVVYVGEIDQLFVANGTDGKLRIYDGNSFKLLNTVDVGEDADNVRYDPTEKKVYVCVMEVMREAVSQLLIRLLANGWKTLPSSTLTPSRFRSPPRSQSSTPTSLPKPRLRSLIAQPTRSRTGH